MAKITDICPVCNGAKIIKSQKCSCCKGSGRVAVKPVKFLKGDKVALVCGACINTVTASMNGAARVSSIVGDTVHLDKRLGGYWTWDKKFLVHAKNIPYSIGGKNGYK